MARVIVSAGHTQQEPGAISGDLREADLTKQIANKVTNKLRNKGIITLATPPELDLEGRIQWINNTGYAEASDDICIEIHINDGGKSGLEGWFKADGRNKSEKLTSGILNEACKLTNLKNQGAKSEYTHALKTLAFVHDTNPTSSLIECLYIDNPSDQKFLKDDTKLDLLATGITNGVLKYFGILQDKQLTTPAQPKIAPFPTFAPSAYSPPPPVPRPRPFSPYGTNTPFPTSPTFGFDQKTPQDREAKKEMIRRKYRQILGRKVSAQDLNYFLNLNLSEDQMAKRIIESQEHADMIKDYQDYKKIRPEYENLKIENANLRAEVKDKGELLDKQNQLIAQKNQVIQSLQQPQVQIPQTNSQSFTLANNGPTLRPPQRPQKKKSFLDKVLDKLNSFFD